MAEDGFRIGFQALDEYFKQSRNHAVEIFKALQEVEKLVLFCVLMRTVSNKGTFEREEPALELFNSKRKYIVESKPYSIDQFRLVYKRMCAFGFIDIFIQRGEYYICTSDKVYCGQAVKAWGEDQWFILLCRNDESLATMMQTVTDPDVMPVAQVDDMLYVSLDLHLETDSTKEQLSDNAEEDI